MSWHDSQVSCPCATDGLEEAWQHRRDLSARLFVLSCVLQGDCLGVQQKAVTPWLSGCWAHRSTSQPTVHQGKALITLHLPEGDAFARLSCTEQLASHLERTASDASHGWRQPRLAMASQACSVDVGSRV